MRRIRLYGVKAHIKKIIFRKDKTTGSPVVLSLTSLFKVYDKGESVS